MSILVAEYVNTSPTVLLPWLLRGGIARWNGLQRSLFSLSDLSKMPFWPCHCLALNPPSDFPELLGCGPRTLAWHVKTLQGLAGSSPACAASPCVRVNTHTHAYMHAHTCAKHTTASISYLILCVCPSVYILGVQPASPWPLRPGLKYFLGEPKFRGTSPPPHPNTSFKISAKCSLWNSDASLTCLPHPEERFAFF